MICTKCGQEAKPLELGKVAGLSFLTAGCFIWIPVLGLVVAPVLLIVSLCALVAKAIGGGWAYCELCKEVVRGEGL